MDQCVTIVVALSILLLCQHTVAQSDPDNSPWDADQATPPPPGSIHLVADPIAFRGALEFDLTYDTAANKPELLIQMDENAERPFALSCRTIDSALHYTLRPLKPGEQFKMPRFEPPSESFLIHVSYPEAAGVDKTAVFHALKTGEHEWQLRALHETGFARLYRPPPSPAVESTSATGGKGGPNDQAPE